MNRGIFERHKPIFKMTVSLKIMVTSGKLTNNDISFFLKSGATLDIKTERPKP